jgi:hypothetical protein
MPYRELPDLSAYAMEYRVSRALPTLKPAERSPQVSPCSRTRSAGKI